MAMNKGLAIGGGGEGSWEWRGEEVGGIGGRHGKEEVRIGESGMEGGVLGAFKFAFIYSI